MKGKAPKSSKECQLSLDSQLFFGDSKVLEYVDQVVENFLAIKKLSEAIPLFDLLTPADEKMMIGWCYDGGWHIEDDCPFVSRFVNNNKKILSKLQIQELHLLDYCFVHDKSFIEDVNENVFAFDGEYFIP
nr:uncharacterized protein LOC109153947 [Ipomoea batatas]